MDLVSLFAVVVFAGCWFLRARAEPDETLAKLFFTTMMVLAVAIGGLGILLRTLSG